MRNITNNTVITSSGSDESAPSSSDGGVETTNLTFTTTTATTPTPTTGIPVISTSTASATTTMNMNTATNASPAPPGWSPIRPHPHNTATTTAMMTNNNNMNTTTTTNTSNNTNTNIIHPSNSIIQTNETIQIESLKYEIIQLQNQIMTEKAGKRKLFHSLVKLANELRKAKTECSAGEQSYWYEGGMWRSPTVLPIVKYTVRQEINNEQNNEKIRKKGPGGAAFRGGGGGREALSLSEIFFNLVIVTGFTRVGVCVSQIGYVDFRSIIYFGIFWTVWNKEASYGTRFDMTDLSATFSTLLICFAVLFASLSVQAPINSNDGTRIMYMAAFVAGLNCLLHVRVAYTSYQSLKLYDTTSNNPFQSSNTITNTSNESLSGQNQQQQQNQQQPQQYPSVSDFSLSGIYNTGSYRRESIIGGGLRRNSRSNSIASALGDITGINVQALLTQHVIKYALFNIIMTLLELVVWIVGIICFPIHYKYRWCIFLLGFLLAQRIPRAFLANDFHAACSRRGVVFILLLGFLLQSIVVVASEFFQYQTPTIEHYSFVGAACLMFFCIKLLYVDDSNTVVAEDHALLVNRWAGFFFNAGQFALLLSTTVMGSGLNLLTHDYMAATAALPGPAKTLVCGGFSAVLFSTFFIKSMHVKRVPTDRFNQFLFIGAYVIQTVVLLIVVAVTACMSFGQTNGFLQNLMQYDSKLLFFLSCSALVVVILGWLDEAVELILYESAADSRTFRVHPFGIWWCLAPDVTDEELDDAGGDLLVEEGTAANRFNRSASNRRLSVLSPLLGSSIANMKEEFQKMSSSNLNFYQTV